MEFGFGLILRKLCEMVALQLPDYLCPESPAVCTSHHGTDGAHLYSHLFTLLEDDYMEDVICNW